jgi:hypothetical protein
MRQLLSLGLVLFAGATLNGADRPAFETLRYNEDWSVLHNSAAASDWLDPVKFVPFGRPNAYLTLGGEARLKYEFYDQPVLNQSPGDDNGFLLQRYLLHTYVHLGSHLRVFSQLQSSLEDGRAGGPRPTDRDDLEVHQAFVEASTSWGERNEATLRVGRQEMAYGSQRLISVRDSPNNRLAFDAVRLLTRIGTSRADAWVSQPLEIDPGTFDDERIRATTFWGAYLTGPVSGIPGLNADIYYLGLARDNARFARGTADERRHSLGARLFGKRQALDWNFEFVGQFGSFGADEIRAWTAASDTGWTFPDLPARPRLFLRANVASGDHGGSHLGTFNPLFPRGAYFNEASLIGPQNLMDFQPGVELALSSSVKLTARKPAGWRVWRSLEPASAAWSERRALRRNFSQCLPRVAGQPALEPHLELRRVPVRGFTQGVIAQPA